MRICGYFWTPNGGWEQKRSENIGVVRAVLMHVDRRRVDGHDEVTGSCRNYVDELLSHRHCGIQSVLKQCSL